MGYMVISGASNFEDDFAGCQLAHRIGEDNAIWGSDYPHPVVVGLSPKQ